MVWCVKTRDRERQRQRQTETETTETERDREGGEGERARVYMCVFFCHANFIFPFFLNISVCGDSIIIVMCRNMDSFKIDCELALGF